MAHKDLELKRLKLEIIKVNTVKEEHLFKIEERFEEIERIKEQVKIQENRVSELTKKLEELLAKQ